MTVDMIEGVASKATGSPCFVVELKPGLVLIVCTGGLPKTEAGMAELTDTLEHFRPVGIQYEFVLPRDLNVRIMREFDAMRFAHRKRLKEVAKEVFEERRLRNRIWRRVAGWFDGR